MFDEHDEEARRIVSEFCRRYKVSHNIGEGFLPEPRVWLMAEIAMSLKKAAGKNEGDDNGS